MAQRLAHNINRYNQMLNFTLGEIMQRHSGDAKNGLSGRKETRIASKLVFRYHRERERLQQKNIIWPFQLLSRFLTDR